MINREISLLHGVGGWAQAGIYIHIYMYIKIYLSIYIYIYISQGGYGVETGRHKVEIKKKKSRR